MQKRFSLFLTVSLLSAGLFTTSFSPFGGKSRQLTLLAKHLAGSFSSAQQAGKDADFYDVTLNVIRIWPKQEDGYWLYVEQAITKTLKKPYRQRIYHVTQKGDTFCSKVYELKQPETYANRYTDKTAFNTLTPDSLIDRPGCAVYLTYHKGVFKGATRGKDCLSDFRGAAYATSEVSVFKDHIESWDRGFDAQGNHLWGSAKGPYLFKRNGKKR